MAVVESKLSGQIIDQKNKSQIFTKVIEAALVGNETEALRLLESFSEKDAFIINLPLGRFLPEYKNGYCLLHIAAMNFMSDLIKRLYDIGAKPNCVDGNGNTPLDLVLKSTRFAGGGVKSGMNFAFVKKDSIEKELSAEEKAKKQAARMNTQNKRMKTLKSLFEKNACAEEIKINRVSNEGTAPIGLAILNGFFEAAVFLYKKGAKLTKSDQEFAEKNKEGKEFLQTIEAIEALKMAQDEKPKEKPGQPYSQVTTKLEKSVPVIPKKSPVLTSQSNSNSKVSEMVKKFSPPATPASDWNSSGKFSAHPKPTAFTQADDLSEKSPVPRKRSATVSSTKAPTQRAIPMQKSAEDPEMPKTSKEFKPR